MQLAPVLKLADIAARIRVHLKRFENDKIINAPYSPGSSKAKLLRYYHAGAVESGSRVFVTFVTYQGSTSLTKKEATAYLEWLDAGNVGTIYDMYRTKD